VHVLHLKKIFITIIHLLLIYLAGDILWEQHMIKWSSKTGNFRFLAVPVRTSLNWELRRETTAKTTGLRENLRRTLRRVETHTIGLAADTGQIQNPPGRPNNLTPILFIFSPTPWLRSLGHILIWSLSREPTSPLAGPGPSCSTYCQNMREGSCR